MDGEPETKRIALADGGDNKAGECSQSGTSSGSTGRFEMTLKYFDSQDISGDQEQGSGDEATNDSEVHASGSSRIEGNGANLAADAENEEVVLSVFWKSGKFGAAFYTVETSEVSILYDIVDVNPEFLITKCFFNQVQPSQVITSGRLAEKFLEALRSLTGGHAAVDHDLDGPAFACRLHTLPGKEYRFESCRARILAVKLPSEPEGLDEEGHLTYIHSLIDLSSESMVFALGGLLQFLDRYWCDINLDVTQRNVPVLSLKIISLDDVVFIDSDSYSALQVFNPQSRTSGRKRWGHSGTREGLSLFGLFNRCRSPLGCKWMRVMFLHPTRDIKVLNERLDVVEFCMKQKNADVLQKMLEGLRSVKSIARILTKIHAVQASVSEWKSLYKTVHSAVLIGELCSAQKDEIALFRQIADCLTDELYQIGQSINTFMNFEESENLNRFVVNPGIDPELDAKKQKYAGMSDLLSAIAHQELAALPEQVQQCRVVYIPEIGYLLGLPLWKDVMADEELQIPGLEFMFKANNIAHYKSARCRELDEVLGDSLVHITKHETSIVIRLVQYVQARMQSISRMVDLLAQLDCLAAMAAVAREQGYVRPALCEDHVLDIKEGRHPLQELCVSEFVANDTLCGGPAPRSGRQHMKLLTGPNASGKSVYLKQVALITYLAHIGSFVPARSAKIGLIHKIFTRIQTVESVATRLSAFMIDLRQMSLALMCSNKRSLLVIDEFGKGTSELDGLALLAASLNSLLEQGENCPFVFVSTHFHHVADLLPNHDNLQLQTLEHLCEEDGQIVYLFKLKDGRVMSSFALQVAENQGIEHSTITRAKQVLEIMKNGTTIKRNPDLDISKKITKKEEIARKFLTLDFDDEHTRSVILPALVEEMKKLGR